MNSMQWKPFSGRLDLLVHMQVDISGLAGAAIMQYLAFSFKGLSYKVMGGCVSAVLAKKVPQCFWTISACIVSECEYPRIISYTLFSQIFWELLNVF